MVKVTIKGPYGEKCYYMDGYLKSNLDLVKTMIRDDGDCVVFVDGPEGSGKSVKAFQMASFLDETFNLSRVVFTPRQFMNAVKTAGQYEAIVYDEAFSGLMSSQALNWVSIMLVKMLAEVRQKNLILFIVCPTFFDSVKYVSIWRTRFLINCYRGNEYQRGFFRFYGFENKKILYMEGKKTYNYHARKPDFYGRFTNFYTIPEASYRTLKHNALVGRKDEIDKHSKLTEFQIQKYIVERLARQESTKWGNLTRIQELIGIKQPTFYKWLRDEREKVKKETQKAKIVPQ
jgi:hypothetical protein